MFPARRPLAKIFERHDRLRCETVGPTVEEQAVKPVSAIVFNLGESPKAFYGQHNKAPTTRMMTAAIIRKTLLEAQAYAELLKPSKAVAPFTYRSTAPGLFDSIMSAGLQSGGGLCVPYPNSRRAER